MISIQALKDSLYRHEAEPFAEALIRAVEARITDPNHGDLHRWLKALEELPHIEPVTVSLDSSAITVNSPIDLTEDTSLALKTTLKHLMPWRKGPYRFFDCFVDTEWRSDWKWDRLKDAISPLNRRKVLDIGCGNGYHLWRMKAQDPRLVIGVDPSLLFTCQFAAFNHYAQQTDIHLLPLKMEALPTNTHFYDTVFSMGVLYHRRSPIDYLRELWGQMRPGGELVLETLVVDGDATTVLVPVDRYARMRNVWFIPSAEALEMWLKRTGFSHIRLVEQSVTSIEEQRSTDWMQYESLAESLDPSDCSLTLEQLPAPKRAILVATRL